MSAAVLSSVSFRKPFLAWSYSPEDEKRFRRILSQTVGVSLLLCLLFALLPKPKEVRVVQEIPPRLAKLLLEKDNVPPPVTKPVAPKQELAQQRKSQDDTTKTPEPKRPEPKREAAKGVAIPEARNPVANKPPGEVDAARRRVAGIGLFANPKDLNELRGAPVAVQLKTDIKQGPGVGTGVGVGVGAGNEPGIPIRSLITSNAQGGSGGINTASYSNYTGGGGLAGRATTLVAGAAGGGGGGGPGGGGGGGKGDGVGLGSGDGVRGAKGGVLSKGGSGKASRSIEEIKLVFERNKGAIYALYNRALREDSSLQGKVVVELKIAPSGEVVSCRVISTELKTPDLESKLVTRIRGFDFGAKDVDTMVVTWPVDFLPS
jgi:outer membrane biosynthesis protein TonB